MVGQAALEAESGEMAALGDIIRMGGSGGKSAFKHTSEFTDPTGTLLTKWEIMINFFQVFGLLYTLVPKDVWPSVWIDLTWWTLAFSFDIDLLLPWDISWRWQYVKFSLFMAIPLALLAIYRYKLSHSAWTERYVTNWQRTKRRALVACLLALLAAAVVALLGDANNWNGGFPTNASLSVRPCGSCIQLHTGRYHV
jgi:hypothetical protein